MNWPIATFVVSLVFGGVNAVAIIRLAYHYGGLVQQVKDLDEKGCSRRRNGSCT